MRHTFTYVVRLMPLSSAASFAASRRFRGIRMVTGTFSELTRNAWISVGVAPESTSSEYFIGALLECRMQYKCSPF